MSSNLPAEDISLTPREREILDLARDGRTNKEIAAALGISRNAVRYHLKELHSKLDTGSARSALTAGLRRVLGLGWIPAGKLGVPATVAVFGGGMALTSVAIVRYAPPVLDGGESPAAVHACPAEFFVGTMTLADFAFGSVTIEELRALNPGVPDGPVPPETLIRVPFDPSRECGEANMTPAGSEPSIGGTPLAQAVHEHAAGLTATPPPAAGESTR